MSDGLSDRLWTLSVERRLSGRRSHEDTIAEARTWIEDAGRECVDQTPQSIAYRLPILPDVRRVLSPPHRSPLHWFPQGRFSIVAERSTVRFSAFQLSPQLLSIVALAILGVALLTARSTPWPGVIMTSLFVAAVFGFRWLLERQIGFILEDIA